MDVNETLIIAFVNGGKLSGWLSCLPTKAIMWQFSKYTRTHLSMHHIIMAL